MSAEAVPVAADLVGAYALDALAPDEIEAFEALLTRDANLADEARRLREAAAWLGAIEALAPPPTLRADVLERARGGSRPDPPLDLYLTEAGRLVSVIDGIPDSALDRPTANGLNVRDLIVHCAAQESLTAQLVGAPTLSEVEERDIDARTAALIDVTRDWSLEAVRALWTRSVDAIRTWAVANPRGSLPIMGAPVSRDDVITIRAFEAWIHADDLRRATGEPLAAPASSHLAVMSDLSARILGLGMLLTDRAHPGKTARLVLTGDGGGDWLVALGGGEAGTTPDVTITAEVVSWCRLVGERLEPEALTHTVEGDAGLAPDILRAASAFATL
jgi:uncharacterized protein (TIGR03083 family)